MRVEEGTALDIVLVRPLIPQNTTFVAKMCIATDSHLHLVGEPGFRITPESVAAAGLTFWSDLKLSTHPDLSSYLATRSPRRCWCVETSGTRLYSEVEFEPEDAIVFGSETVGLGRDDLEQVPAEQIIRIPIFSPHVRSLNLSNAVAIVLFEARRQFSAFTRGV